MKTQKVFCSLTNASSKMVSLKASHARLTESCVCIWRSWVISRRISGLIGTLGGGRCCCGGCRCCRSWLSRTSETACEMEKNDDDRKFSEQNGFSSCILLAKNLRQKMFPPKTVPTTASSVWLPVKIAWLKEFFSSKLSSLFARAGGKWNYFNE